MALILMIMAITNHGNSHKADQYFQPNLAPAFCACLRNIVIVITLLGGFSAKRSRARSENNLEFCNRSIGFCHDQAAHCLLPEQIEKLPHNLRIQLALAAQTLSKTQGKFGALERTASSGDDVEQNFGAMAGQTAIDLVKQPAPDHEKAAHRIAQAYPA